MATSTSVLVSMEKHEEFLLNFFTHLSQLCFDKAKEFIEKEREWTASVPAHQSGIWLALLSYCPQIILAEKSYMEIGFLQNKNKSFLRKDNSLRSIYESLKTDVRRLEDGCKQNPNDRYLMNFCQNLCQFFTARINLIDFYDKIYIIGSTRFLKYNELLTQVDSIIQRHSLSFTDISLTPIKAVFSMECEILQQLFKALTELQRLQFLPSLSLIHGAHARLTAWENKMQNRETWKLGFLKNSPLPLLYQWLLRFKGAVLSKFSLYFHDTLALQTTSSDMRQLCSKLHYDYYQKMIAFQRKYDAISVLLLSDNQVSCDTTDYDSFPVIVSYPPKSPSQHEVILKMITDTAFELAHSDKIIYKYSTQEQCTYILATVESNIYLILIFESKKSEKDLFISNFVSDLCTNLRCSKVFMNLKNPTK